MTITKEGALASFYTVNKAPIKHLKVYFSPKQAGEGTPSPENVREIEGWNGVELTHCGKNLYNPSTVTMNMEVLNTGVLLSTGTSNNWCASDYIVVRPNTTYTASALLTKGAGYSACYDENKNKTSSKNETKGADAQTVINTGNTDKYVRLTVRIGDKLNTMFEEGPVATEYEPYRGQTHTLDWTNDIGTVYGGYVDLVTGELVEEWKNFIVDGDTIKVNKAYHSDNEDKFGAGVVWFNPTGISGSATASNFIIANKLKISTGSSTLPYMFVPYNGNLYNIFYVGK